MPRAISLQGVYSASKYGVEGFTDALRMELEKEGAPISVILIKPAAAGDYYAYYAPRLMDRPAGALQPGCGLQLEKERTSRVNKMRRSRK